jgi:hypothetical protein
MRGKTAFPLTRSGDELVTCGVPAGSVLVLEGEVVGAAGVTPGGRDGARTNGDPEAPEGAPAAAGTAVAAKELGQGSVRKTPLTSRVNPFRQRATTRKRYVVAGSRPASVVRAVCALRATVVGDQIP